ncbi:MAG: hypothetical protein IJT72_06780 [Lachnospiraceae bacterium]|nr:hypothetical protein [Lachnospiraceae bacterium]
MFKFLKNLKNNLKFNNQGSTMVEVLVGFTILVFVLVECMVHIVGVSSEMVEKSVDMQKDRMTVNREMYQKDAEYTNIDGARAVLILDEEKTNVTANQAKPVQIVLSADLKKFYSEEAGLSIYKLFFVDE